MNLELDGKVTLITGGSKGIGLACARAFSREGARVIIVSRSKDNLDAAKRALADDGLSVTALSANLSDGAEAERVVNDSEAEVGPIAILVNSAGGAKRVTPQELSPDKWRTAMDAKFFTYMNAMDYVLPRMVARKSGVVVNIIGTGGKLASPIHLPGGAANAALMLATAGLASAYARRGVRVVGINPGPTKTERVAHSLAAEAKHEGVSEDEMLKRTMSRLPLGRLPEPHEIADLVVFAASERARLLTGAILSADAGATPTVV
jgi:NAD(P)-dependent dehydrogenase (short-subunit alcohol dehydrogenase family)